MFNWLMVVLVHIFRVVPLSLYSTFHIQEILGPGSTKKMLAYADNTSLNDVIPSQADGLTVDLIVTISFDVA